MEFLPTFAQQSAASGQMDISTIVGFVNTAGSIAVVVLFLKFLTDERVARKDEQAAERESRQKIEESRQEALKHINTDCHAHSARLLEVVGERLDSSNKVIQENTRVLGAISTQLAERQLVRTKDDSN